MTIRSTPASEPSSPRRADARRNNERVVAAAIEIFRQFGTQASVPQIAAKAQVGKATVYRSFATKELLLESITQTRLEEAERRMVIALESSGPERAFHNAMLELFDVLAGDRLLAERLADDQSSATSALLQTLAEAQQRSRIAGALLGAATLQDLRVLVCGVAMQLTRLGERDPKIWRRYGELVIRAFSS
ncbi:TetR/AcrR family transcriptional regulator [Herbiconiux sp. CPCC 205763]|uniref:TetR/AcrR family transcriptional regulator n=1 Tax=Herbiconiux aconitum TaxID=2970913 RepID=A0ABT2GQE2_9MICO|nr:TetR/AcrR family transcriptional regulator [Herbiconiux aconitum]MCS5717782.1 TetR/AcrR family transcriptional regulator [Herbiconiux aconitum]